MRPIDHLRGAMVLAAAFTMLILGFPGLDMLHADRWVVGSPQRARQLKQPWGPIAVGAADLNRAVRIPLVGVLTPLQRPLRLAQTWGLYGRGPGDVRRMEIRVDGELQYRSGDPDYRWLRTPLRYRKLRPIADAYCTGSSKNGRGLLIWITSRARADFPGATEVTVACAVRPWPGTGEPKIEYRRTLSAPDWLIR